MRRKSKDKHEGKTTSKLLTQARVDSGGSGKLKNGAARLLRAAKKQESDIEFAAFWKNVGQQGNDNATEQAASYYRPVIAAALTLMLMAGAMVSLDSSAIVSQAVIHTDDRVLSATMALSPDLLGAILNYADVGE